MIGSRLVAAVHSIPIDVEVLQSYPPSGAAVILDKEVGAEGSDPRPILKVSLKEE